MPSTIGDIFDIPEHVHQGDFVLHLTEGVSRPADTLRTYVVTPQLVGCFDQALSLIQSALATNTSKGAYLHGSFGSGKSHFMAVLTLLLAQYADARAVPALAAVVSKHNAWTQGKRFLVIPYHMIGASSLESAILGRYAAYVRQLHPDAPTPGFYQDTHVFQDAQRLRASMGDSAFFAQLAGAPDSLGSGWGNLADSWDAASFEAAIQAPPLAEERLRLTSALIDAYFQSARELAVTGNEGFVSLDEGLAIMARHAQSLGYEAVILFLDELILWLASHAADLAFVNREGQKVAKLVEAMVAERPIPIVSFIARQRDLRELVGEHVPGAEQLGFADVLNWWEARFDTITLEDRNLPAIAEQRLLRPKSPEAQRLLSAAFDKTTRVRQDVLNTLLTRSGDRELFRQVYPFSPALMQTLIALSALLQRERTALKLMLQLLVKQRDTLQLGDMLPVGDLFEVIMEGDEPFTQAMRLHFEHARRLYRQKFVPMLEQEHGVTLQQVQEGSVETRVAQRFHADDRLLKTLILSALAPEVEALHALTPSRLAALNHGTIRSPIPGQESQTVLLRCRNWAAQVGEIKIADDSANPVISLHLVGVDTEGILENAKSVDRYGSRLQKARSLLYAQLGLSDDGSLFPSRYDIQWRGTRRSCEVLCCNLRTVPLDSLRPPEGVWRLVIDLPLDEPGHTPKDHRAKFEPFQESGESAACLLWLPTFFTTRTLDDLGRLVLLEHVLSGNNLNQCGGHLSTLEREQARILLHNQCDQMRQRLSNAMLAAYGVSNLYAESIHSADRLEQQFFSLTPALHLQPPVGASLKDALAHLFAQALAYQFPAHPEFAEDMRLPALRQVLEVVRQATQARDGRLEIERSQRDTVRRLAVPLQLGDMGEAHFVLRDTWKNHFLRQQAEAHGAALSVRRLRAWMEQPQPMGLPREVQNLVILSFALQGHYSFSLHGSPVEPRLESLDDSLELQAQALPDAATWEDASQRASALFQLSPLPLLHATNVAKLVETLSMKAREHRRHVEQFCTALRQALERLAVEPQTAPRLHTAQAAATLLHRLSTAAPEHLLDVLVQAPLLTSAAAMAQVIARADSLCSALEPTVLECFEDLQQLPPERAAEAQAVLASVREALSRDEHVLALAETVHNARPQARALLSRLLRTPVAAPPSAPPLAQPEPVPERPAPSHLSVPAPVAARTATAGPDSRRHELAGDQQALRLQDAITLFAQLRHALEADSDLRLDVAWRLHQPHGLA